MEMNSLAKKLRIIWLLPIVIALTGCATSYHRLNYTGEGYSEILTNPDSFIVTFKGNVCTSPETVAQYALLRAAELTLKNGYKYFIVNSSIDQTASFNYNSFRASASASNINAVSFSNTLVKPGASIFVKCFKEKPQIDGSIDAEYYWNANRESEESTNHLSHRWLNREPEESINHLSQSSNARWRSG